MTCQTHITNSLAYSFYPHIHEFKHECEDIYICVIEYHFVMKEKAATCMEQGFE